jgi:hypothetical protein
MVTGETFTGIRVEDLRRRQPPVGQLGELSPGQAAAALAASSQRAKPQDLKRVSELLQSAIVTGNSVILVPAAYHLREQSADS